MVIARRLTGRKSPVVPGRFFCSDGGPGAPTGLSVTLKVGEGRRHEVSGACATKSEPLGVFRQGPALTPSMSHPNAIHDHPSPRGSADFGRSRILCVEDVPVNQELMRLCLEGEGFEVEVAADGMAAVRAVTRRFYDLVFMDVQMPGMDGLAATQAIRALGGRFADLPIIALSANILGEDLLTYRRAGMSAHVAKPFTAATLAACVRRWTGVRPARRNAVLENFTRQAGWESVRSLLEMLKVQVLGFQALPRDDADRISRQAHALHGAASALGFPRLAGACRALERASRSDHAYAQTLEMVLAETQNALSEIDFELSQGL